MNKVCHLTAHAKCLIFFFFFYTPVAAFNFQVHTEKSSMVYHIPFLYKKIPIRAGWKKRVPFHDWFQGSCLYCLLESSWITIFFLPSLLSLSPQNVAQGKGTQVCAERSQHIRPVCFSAKPVCRKVNKFRFHPDPPAQDL